jgi:hypothetical protein
MDAQAFAQLAKVTFKAASTPMPFQFVPPPNADMYSKAQQHAGKAGLGGVVSEAAGAHAGGYAVQQKANDQLQKMLGSLKSAVDPMCLFLQASPSEWHKVAAQTIGKQVEDFMLECIMGICGAVEQWCKLAVVTQVQINSVTGMLNPGKLKGPPMEPLLLKGLPKKTAQQQKYSKAIAKAVGRGWDDWAKGYQAQVLYPPTFAIMPGPLHPPTPNIPLPVIMGSSSNESAMSASALASKMTLYLREPRALHHQILFHALGTAFALSFIVWKATTLLTNIIGTGPVPSFAPPACPLGPVANGTGVGAPGCLQSIPTNAESLRNMLEKPFTVLPEKAAQLERQAKAAVDEQKKNLESMQKFVDQVSSIDPAKIDPMNPPKVELPKFETSATREAGESVKDPWKDENAKFKQDREDTKKLGREHDKARRTSGSY